MSSYKTVIVFNEQFAGPHAVLMNAACHLAQGLGWQQHGEAHSRFVDYVDANGGRLPSISFWPLVLLTGRTAKMWALFDALELAGAPRGAFVGTMIEGGSEVQMDRTRQSGRDELPLVAVAGFASVEVLTPLTKRFSLWRPERPQG